MSDGTPPAEVWTASAETLYRDGVAVGTLISADFATWVAEACETLTEMDKAQAAWEASGEAAHCSMVDIGIEQMRVQGGADWTDQDRREMGQIVSAAEQRMAEEKAAERAEFARDFAERVLLVSEVMTGYRCPACHGMPASHKYPRYRCGCGQQWDLTRSEQYRLSHEHSPRKILLRMVDTGELPEIPTKTRGEA